MRQLTEYFSYLKYLLVLLIIFALVIFFSILVARCLSSFFDSDLPSLSSWVQAVGTIFAVISGFGLTMLQFDHQQKKMNEQAHQIYSLTLDAANLVFNRLNNALRRDSNKDLQKPKADKAIQSIANIPIEFIPTGLEDFIRITTNLNALNEGIDFYWKEGRKTPNRFINTLIETEKFWDDWNKVAHRFGIKTKTFPGKNYQRVKELINN